MSALIRVRDLGAPELTLQGEEPPRELLWRKNLALLVYLARSPGYRRTREHLVGMLWPESDESSARHSLNEALRTLRRHGHEEIVFSEGSQVVLGDEIVELDTDRFVRHVETGRNEDAAALVRGRFLEGFEVPDANRLEDWLAAERMHWTGRSVDALAAVAEERLRSGDLSGAREAAGRALTLDPLSAAGTRALMRMTALAGERASALGIFEEYGEQIRGALGIDPDPETRRLADRIQRERSWRLPESVRPEVRERGELPLIGRAEDLKALVETWEECARGQATGLIVIAGEPGSGRSRMLEELAARARLDGAVIIAARMVPGDRDREGAGIDALCRGGLESAPGLVVAPPDALGAVARRIPEWRERFSEEVREVNPEAAKEMGRAFVEIVRVVAEEQPVLLTLDDAPWCDSSSLGVLHELLRDLDGLPVCLAVTVTDRPGPPELDRLRSQLGRSVRGTVVELEPLDQAALHEMASRLIPDYQGDALDRLSRRVAVDSAGLPLLAVELLHGIRLGLEFEGTDVRWPATRQTLDQTRPGDLPDPVVGAIRTGYWALSSDARQIARAAAALGHRVTAEELYVATGLKSSELHRALDELEWSRWLEADGQGYSFVARIVAEVLREDMLTPGETRRFRDAVFEPSGS